MSSKPRNSKPAAKKPSSRAKAPSKVKSPRGKKPAAKKGAPRKKKPATPAAAAAVQANPVAEALARRIATLALDKKALGECSKMQTPPGGVDDIFAACVVLLAGLHKGVVFALQDPGTRERLVSSGAEPVGSTPEEFSALMRAEVVKWAKVVKAAGIRQE